MVFYNNVIAGAAGAGGEAAGGFKIERSLRFNSADSAHLKRTPSSSGNRRTFTFSCWVKLVESSGTRRYFFGASSANTGSPYNFTLGFGVLNDQLCVTNAANDIYKTAAVFRDFSAWYHIVWVVDTTETTTADRIKVYVNGVQQTLNFQSHGGANPPSLNEEYPISWTKSHGIGCIFDNAGTTVVGPFNGYLADVHFVDGQALAPTDFGESDADTGVWNPIAYSGTYGTNGYHLDFSDNSSNAALGNDAAGNNHWTVNNIESGAPGNVDASGYTVTSGPASGPNDASLVFDGDTSTRTYAHGYGTHYVHITTTSSPIAVSSTDTFTIWWKTSSTNPQNATLELIIDGTARTYTTFTNTGQGSVQSNTVTVGYTGDIQAIKLNEASASNPGELHINAIQLNGTYLITTQETDSLLDTPTNYSASSGNNGGNYATLNALNLHSSSNDTLSNGNLECSMGSGSAGLTPSTIGFSSGKFYYEVVFSGSVAFLAGIRRSDSRNYDNSYTYHADGNKYTNGGSATSYGATYTDGDVIGVAVDMDAGTLTFYKNGASQGQAFSGISGTYTFIQGKYSGSGGSYIVNFGQRPFAYTPPTGHVSLCTQNLDDPSIADPSTAFDILTYTGTGSATTHSGLNHTPDFIWTKSRSLAELHLVQDTVRGVGKNLYPHLTNAEDTAGYVSSFTSDGFTVPGGASLNNQLNATYVAWAWNGGDLATNSAYNQSEVWSSNVSSYLNALGSEPATNLFDGDTSSQFFSSSTSGSGIKFVPTTAITGSIELYLRNGDTANSTFSYSLDNGSNFTNLTTTGGNGSYVSIGNQTISNTNGIIVRHVTTAGTNSVNWRAIKVDNKILVDAGVIPAGSLNSSAYDQSQTWSNSLTSTQTFGLAESRAFDGDLSTLAATSNATTANILFTKTFTNVTKLRVYMDHATSYRVRINGGTWHTDSSLGASSNASWRDLTSIIPANGTVNSIESDTGGQNNGVNWSAVEVNGRLLVDSGVTVTNVPAIASTVRANPSAGFSIVEYGGQSGGGSWGHGLNAVPDFIIFKRYTATQNWFVWWREPDGTYLEFEGLNNDRAAYSTRNNVSATSTTVTLTTAAEFNSDTSSDYLAYCFSSVSQYSSFGTYTGNGSTDGPFVYTGFRPRFVLTKPSSAVQQWAIWDAARDPYNATDDVLWPNASSAEDTDSVHDVDFLSIGFKLRYNHAMNNSSGVTYIYAAFAEHPLKYARAR